MRPQPPTPNTAVNAENVGGLTANQLVQAQQVLYAVVSANGDLLAGNALSSTRDDTGDYRVTFDRSLRDCAGSATAGLSTLDPDNSVSVSATLSVYMVGAELEEANIMSWGQESQAADSGFMVTIVCPTDEVTDNANSG